MIDKRAELKIYLDPRVKQEIKILAARRYQTMNALVSEIIRRHLEQQPSK
jgi:hypothetical protein